MDIVLFGIQGSGKGTQAKKLCAQFGHALFEAGGALRAIAASGSELGKIVKEYIDAGHHVPQDIIMEVVAAFIADLPEGRNVVFDGIPRNMGQKDAFDALMGNAGRDFRCVELIVDEEAAVKRILGRAKTEGRVDDANEEAIRTRLALFHEKTQPVIDAYREEGNMADVDGEGTVEEVYGRLKKKVQEV
jgi:adenylate kinase